MSFKLSQRSMDRLEGVHPDMIKVVTEAITLSKIDFGVIGVLFICALMSREWIL